MTTLPFYKINTKPSAWSALPAGGSVTVPVDFVGVHLGNWPKYRPSSGPSNPPNFGYSWVRAQSQVFSNGAGGDAGPLLWSKLHTGPGTYLWSSNSEIDEIFSTFQAAGKKMIFDLQSTPDWASSGVVADPWGVVGGNVKPANLANLSDFITALLTRYSSVIRAVEVWNEPSFGAGTGFFIGSAADMVSVANTVYTATKAVDPNIKVIAPCYQLDAFLAAGGGVHVDAICMHSYAKQGKALLLYAQDQRRIAASAGFAGLPLWETERGFDENPATIAATIAAMGGQEAAATEIKRVFLIEAALGVQACLLYSFETGLHGDMKNNASIQAAIDWAYQTLSGATITSCVVHEDGRVEAVVDGFEVAI